MNEALTWGALIASAGAILALAKFWMEMGADRQRLTNVDAIAMATSAKVELINSSFMQFQRDADRNFASTNDLHEAERRMAMAVDGLGSRFDRMAERLDRVLESISNASRS